MIKPPLDRPLRIYAENVRVRDDAYQIREAGLREAIERQVGAGRIEITVRFADEPDFEALARADVFVGSGFDPKRLAQHGTALRVVHCTSAGIERYLPLTWLPAGAVMTNSRGVHVEKAKEFGMLSLLMLNNQIPRYSSSQRGHRWAPLLGPCIHQKKVLIYGVGAVGGAVAESAAKLGMTVYGIRRSAGEHPAVDKMFDPSALHLVLPEVDFLVVTCPLTSKTANVIGPAEIALMRPTAGLVNISRARVVDYAALIAALRSGRLAGAILDVFAEEPLPPDSELWDVPNLFITPHVSCDDPKEYIARCVQILARNIHHLLKVKPLENVVNGDREY